jgi:hypothetical protein
LHQFYLERLQPHCFLDFLVDPEALQGQWILLRQGVLVDQFLGFLGVLLGRFVQYVQLLQWLLPKTESDRISLQQHY